MDSPTLTRIALALLAFLLAMAVVLILLRIKMTKRHVESYIAKNGLDSAVRMIILIGFFAIGSLLTILLS